jgi:hypothetical protein
VPASRPPQQEPFDPELCFEVVRADFEVASEVQESLLRSAELAQGCAAFEICRGVAGLKG